MRNLALFILLLTLSSCISNRSLVHYYSKTYGATGLNNPLDLNKSYKNLDTAKERQLFSCLGASYKHNWDEKKNKISDSAQINLSYDGDTRLWVRVHSQDTNTSFVLRVKNKGHYLSVKRKLRIWPIPFFYFYWESKQILFNDQSGRLVSVSRKMSTGWVVFMVAGNDANSTSVFESISRAGKK